MKFLSSKGFSLVEIMIAIGLVGIAGVAVMTLTESSNKEAKWGEMAFAKSEFVGSLGKYLASSRGCEDVRGCDNPSGCIPSDLPAISPNKDIVLNWKVAGIEGNPGLKMEKGREFRLFKVSDLKVESVDKYDSDTWIGGFQGKKGFVIINLTLQIKASLNRKDVSAPNRNYSYQFKVPAVIDNNNKILGCFESQSLQKSCEAIGGSSDLGTCKQQNVCRIKSSCFLLKTTSGSPVNPPYPSPPPGLLSCSSNPCVGGEKIVTGGKSNAQRFGGCVDGSKNPCYADTSAYLIESCMICSDSSTSGGSGTSSTGSVAGGSVTGGGGIFGGGGGGGGFGSGSGSF